MDPFHSPKLTFWQFLVILYMLCISHIQRQYSVFLNYSLLINADPIQFHLAHFRLIDLFADRCVFYMISITLRIHG